MPSRSLTEFQALLQHVEHLIETPGKIRTGRGRRFNQEAIHRAGTVMTIAAWQAYIEKVVIEAYSAIEATLKDVEEEEAPPPNWAINSFLVAKVQLKQVVGRFSTPNVQNVRGIFDNHFGVDPTFDWYWRSGRRDWTASDMCGWTDDWVKIRHTIAHGSNLPSNIDWIKGDNGVPRLTLWLLRDCKAHFEHIAKKTDTFFVRHLRQTYNAYLPQ